MHKLSDYRKSNIKEEILEVIFLIGMFVVLWQYYRYSYISHFLLVELLKEVKKDKIIILISHEKSLDNSMISELNAKKIYIN